jgi:hemerythrin-like domain-containing protein
MGSSTGITDSRRKFISSGVKLAAFAGIAGLGLHSSCKQHEKDEEEQKVSPPEDLMQEHGILNRVLLIYDTCRLKLVNTVNFPTETLYNAAAIIREFIEDYHEKQEEDYIFPRFKKANTLVDLTEILLQQHNAGRSITDGIMQAARATHPSDNDVQRLIFLLTSFNTMYRPHEAREDTVLFPAFRKLVSRHEYDSLGEDFEKNEHKLFGADGFEKIVEKVATIERSLGIYDLAQFTPKV